MSLHIVALNAAHHVIFHACFERTYISTSGRRPGQNYAEEWAILLMRASDYWLHYSRADRRAPTRSSILNRIRLRATVYVERQVSFRQSPADAPP